MVGVVGMFAMSCKHCGGGQTEDGRIDNAHEQRRSGGWEALQRYSTTLIIVSNDQHNVIIVIVTMHHLHSILAQAALSKVK